MAGGCSAVPDQTSIAARTAALYMEGAARRQWGPAARAASRQRHAEAVADRRRSRARSALGDRRDPAWAAAASATPARRHLEIMRAAGRRAAPADGRCSRTTIELQLRSRGLRRSTGGWLPEASAIVRLEKWSRRVTKSCSAPSCGVEPRLRPDRAGRGGSIVTPRGLTDAAPAAAPASARPSDRPCARRFSPSTTCG